MLLRALITGFHSLCSHAFQKSAEKSHILIGSGREHERVYLVLDFRHEVWRKRTAQKAIFIDGINLSENSISSDVDFNYQTDMFDDQFQIQIFYVLSFVRHACSAYPSLQSSKHMKDETGKNISSHKGLHGTNYETMNLMTCSQYTHEL